MIENNSLSKEYTRIIYSEQPDNSEYYFDEDDKDYSDPEGYLANTLHDHFSKYLRNSDK